MRPAVHLASGAVLTALLAGASLARAQDAEYTPEFDPDPFVLTSDPTSIALTEGARPLDKGALAIGLALRLGGPPLHACRVAEDGGCAVEGDLVTGRFASDLTFAYGLGRLGLHAQLPIVLSQGSDFEPAAGEEALGSTGIGDLRVGGKAWLLRAGDLVLGWDATVSLPTGGGKNFIGNAGVGVENRALVDWRAGALSIGGGLGYAWRQRAAHLANLYVDDELLWSIGGEYAITPDRLSAGLALYGRVGVVSPDDAMSTDPLAGEERPAELLASGRYWATASVAIEVGVGAGLGEGYGSPSFRALAGARWIKRPPPELSAPIDDDRDDDGIVDASDRCIDDPEDRDGWEDEDGCPDRDNDGDGIVDASDRCADVAEDLDGWEDEDGCPDDDNDGDGIADAQDQCDRDPEDVDGFQDEDGCPDDDNDGDGIADAGDGCPNDPEDVDTFEDADGCPDLDNDGDGLVDTVDQCPLAAEVYNAFKDEDGCPDKGKVAAVVTTTGVELNETIYFETDRARIKKRSHRLLDAVAAALAAHGSLRIRIEGHTDDRGSEAYNLELSQRRAEAVREYLIDKGIDGGRLEAVGYGKTRPKVESRGARARSKNRRVEFVIVDADQADTTP